MSIENIKKRSLAEIIPPKTRISFLAVWPVFAIFMLLLHSWLDDPLSSLALFAIFLILLLNIIYEACDVLGVGMRDVTSVVPKCIEGLGERLFTNTQYITFITPLIMSYGTFFSFKVKIEAFIFTLQSRLGGNSL